MFKVFVADAVWAKIELLENYLIDELKLSEAVVLQRTDRMRQFLKSISPVLRYPVCRFKQWCDLGYSCAVFEKSWILLMKNLKKVLLSATCRILHY
ncbi:MAG: hypothetical protein LBU91_09200 [Bacteroidales bacterium]|jgi:hypothetical protein|nr:hypothetical protein [Bacteroidales bacterium]